MTNLKDILKAWIDGKQIQVKAKQSDCWVDKESYNDTLAYDYEIIFSPTYYDYRIKPEEVVKYVTPEHFEYALRIGVSMLQTKPWMHNNPSELTDSSLKLTFLNNKLTKAEIV